MLTDALYVIISAAAVPSPALRADKESLKVNLGNALQMWQACAAEMEKDVPMHAWTCRMHS